MIRMRFRIFQLLCNRRQTMNVMQCRFSRCYHLNQVVFKTVPKNLKGKNSSSQEWITRHLNDPYVKKAKEMNYRARSAFKLIEMNDKLKLLKPGMIVVECGAAPGAWSQVTVERINSDEKYPDKPIGRLIGIDLLPIAPLPGATFLPFCDFTCPDTKLKIGQVLFGQSSQTGQDQEDHNFDKRIVDIILSDMAPNASGIRDMDNARICNLVRSALKFALEFAKPGSHFLTKIWAGNEMKSLESDILKFYKSVQHIKPHSSRDDSSEIFLFAKVLKKN